MGKLDLVELLLRPEFAHHPLRVSLPPSVWLANVPRLKEEGHAMHFHRNVRETGCCTLTLQFIDGAPNVPDPDGTVWSHDVADQF